MIAHKVVDAFSGRWPLAIVPGFDPEKAARLGRGIAMAHKFDFGSLALEHAGVGSFMLPKLTLDETKFWSEKLIPLPFNLCWFEFVIGASRSGIFIQGHPEGVGWIMTRVDILHWRRSHLRTYESGKKAVIPRMLVGREDLGEISHDYRIA